MIDEYPRHSELDENQLVAHLPQSVREHFRAIMQIVELKSDQIIQLGGVPIGMVYFPITAVLSLVSILADGSSTELGMVGNEGMAGVPALLGTWAQPFEMVVQVPGTAYRMRSTALSHEARNCAPLEVLLLRYTQAFLDQVAQGAACHSHHSLKQRLCRSLLTIDDSVQADRFQLTQELLGRMLGVGRPSVSLAAESLQHAGLITYRRGAITIIDRPGLEATTCECYGFIRDRYDRLINSARHVMQ
ncbi:MAG TPA: Crp/Fnr family transcriptional regulator [Ktedonobacterales bacterium]